jgi:hypothetical protein
MIIMFLAAYFLVARCSGNKHQGVIMLLFPLNPDLVCSFFVTGKLSRAYRCLSNFLNTNNIGRIYWNRWAGKAQTLRFSYWTVLTCFDTATEVHYKNSLSSDQGSPLFLSGLLKKQIPSIHIFNLVKHIFLKRLLHVKSFCEWHRILKYYSDSLMNVDTHLTSSDCSK